MLGRMMLTVVAALLAAFAAGAQDNAGGGRRGGFRRERAGGMMPMAMSPRSTGPTIIKPGEHAVYLLVSGMLYAYDAKTLQVLAKKDLNEEGTATRAAAGDAVRGAFANMDKNGDGRLTPDELPVPEALFGRFDRNADGAVTEDEIPMRILEGMVGLGMRMGGAVDTPALEVHPTDGSVYVYYNGYFYRLDGRTLDVQAKVKVEVPQPERPAEPPQGQPGQPPERFAPPAGAEPLF